MSLSERFDSTFQSRMLSLAVQQPHFLSHFSDIFSSSLFSTQYHKDLASWLVKHHEVYRTPPSLVSMRKILRDNIPPSDPLFKGYKTLVEQIYGTEVLDHEHLKDQLTTAAKFQSLKGALLRMTDMVDKGDFESLSNVLNAAFLVGSGTGDIGLDIRNNLEKSILMFDTLEQPVELGFKTLESFTGGFFPGELTAVIAPAGRGKTAVLGSFAHGIARRNECSIYYTLEIRDRRLALRMYARIAKQPIKEVVKDYAIAKERLKRFNLGTGGTTIIKFWPSDSVTVDTIRSHLMKCHGLGIKPTAIFVDYVDLLRPARYRDRPDLEITDMYKAMRSLGAEFNLHVFTASQAKTESWSQEIIGMGDAAGSQGKETTVDNWISVNRTASEQAANLGRVYVGKARMERSGRVLHIAMDLDRMTIYELKPEDYIRRMRKAGQKVTENGRPVLGKSRMERKSDLDAYYTAPTKTDKKLDEHYNS